MVRQHGIIPWDLYSLVLTHPTAPYGRRSHPTCTLPHPTTLPPYGRLREAIAPSLKSRPEH
ncbi:hypothetical protein AP9108_20090 [Arthrospira sp. PCC 9108]|nr:hypothetical protein AP9108_20090 [Arthrospira sp. PCC 9108]